MVAAAAAGRLQADGERGADRMVRENSTPPQPPLHAFLINGTHNNNDHNDPRCWGPDQIVDFAFSLGYALALASATAVCLARAGAPPAARLLGLLLPAAAGAADLVENALMVQPLLGGAAKATAPWAAAAARASRAKWALLAAAVAVLVLSGAAAAFAAATGRKPGGRGGARKAKRSD